MDLSIVVFDLRDAIEELREERAELLKRIEALEDRADEPDRGGAANSPRNEYAQVESAIDRPACEIQRGENHCNDEQPHKEGRFDQARIIPPPSVKHQPLESLQKDCANQNNRDISAGYPRDEFAKPPSPTGRQPVCPIQTGQNECNGEQPEFKGFFHQARINVHSGILPPGGTQ